MLYWICGATGRNRIRNENIRERERVGVETIVEKMVETRLGWFGNVERRPMDYVVGSIDSTGFFNRQMEKNYKINY